MQSIPIPRRILFSTIPSSNNHWKRIVSSSYNNKSTTTTTTTTTTASRLSLSSTAFKRPSCPFQVLGVSRETSYGEIKKSFLKIAMQNHPDIVNQQLNNDNTVGENEKKKRKEECIQIFMNARQAFESIVPLDHHGMGCTLRDEVEQDLETNPMKMSREEFDAWFLNETGKNNPYQFDLDPATIREVADMTEKLGDFGGGERDGGMWSLARMISQTVKSNNSGGDNNNNTSSILRLEAGDIKDNYHHDSFIGRDIGDGRIRRRRQSRF